MNNNFDKNNKEINNKNDKTKIFKGNPYNNPRISINKNIVKDHIKSRRSMFNLIEIGGYKAANLVHKFSTLMLISFFLGNLFYILYAYNKYWKIKRQNYLNI